MQSVSTISLYKDSTQESQDAHGKFIHACQVQIPWEGSDLQGLNPFCIFKVSELAVRGPSEIQVLLHCIILARHVPELPTTRCFASLARVDQRLLRDEAREVRVQAGQDEGLGVTVNPV